MKKQLVGFVLPLLICVFIPLEATADPIHLLGIASRAGSIEPGESETFTADVYNNQNGNRVSGQTVTFSVSPDDGTVSLSITSATTDSNGQASTTLSTGSASAGTYWVTATLNNGRSVSGRAIVETSTSEEDDPPPPEEDDPPPPEEDDPPPPEEDDPPPPPELSIAVVHSPGSGKPGKSLTFIVEVREHGRPAAEKTVTFSITSGDGNARLGYYGTATTESWTTGSSGRASTTIQLGNDASGSYTVTASVGSVSVSRTATVDTPPPPPDGPVTRSMYRVESIPFYPGDTVTFSAEVRQTTGGVNRGVSGETITFSLSPDNGTASLSTTSGTTDSNGEVRTKLTLSSSASGSYYVTATYGDGTTKTHSTGTVYNQNKPRGFILGMRYNSGSIEPGEIKTFTAEVQKDGNWISGQTVAFSVSPDDGTVSLSTTSGTTNSNGRASTTLITESNSSGTYTVTATLDNGQSIPGRATVETSTAPPPSRTIVLSISDLGPLNPGDSVTFTALVREGGNRLSGQTVTFSVSPDDETTSLSTASATTDSNGDASTTLTLGSSASPGSYYVTATLDNGQSASNSTWIASEEEGPNHSSLDPSPPSDESQLDPSPPSDESHSLKPNNLFAKPPPNRPNSILVEWDPPVNTEGLDFYRLRWRFEGDGKYLYSVPDGTIKKGTTSFSIGGFNSSRVLEILLCACYQNPWKCDEDTCASTKAVPAGKRTAPPTCSLADNYPNPFNPSTTIQYALPQAAHVELTVYNVLGQLVKTLVSEHQSAGQYAVEWDATGLASGLYFYRLQAGAFRQVKKAVLLY